jgi:plastocyanin
MRSLFFSAALGVAALVLLGATPSEGQAQGRRHHHGRVFYYYPPRMPYGSMYSAPMHSAPMYPRNSAPTYSTPTYSAPTYEQEAVEARVSLFDNYFEPKRLTVRSGTTVYWTNYGLHRHTVTSATGQFDSGELDHGATFSVTLTQPGVYQYYCRIHPREMRATVVVQ